MQNLFTQFALAQGNFTVGAVAANVAKIKTLWQQAEALGADFVIFPEMAITGYPIEDLALQPHFRAAAQQGLQQLIAFSESLTSAALIGGLGEREGHATNSAYLVEGGKLLHTQDKVSLPNYGVFDEKRHFKKGPLPPVVSWRGIKLGILICEDLWQPARAKHLAEAGAELLISINGSPFELGKRERRHMLAERVCTTHHLPLIYVNMVAGQDEIVMDGGSFAMNAEGKVTHQSPQFEESLSLVSYPFKGQGTGHQALSEEAQLWEAMKLGLKDYVQKSGFGGVLIGLSGGIDSALTAEVAVDALGAEKVHTVFMPSPYTSQESVEDAAECARLLGVSYETIPIAPLMEAMERALIPYLRHDERNETSHDITMQNLQSRLRGNILMALSNKHGWMVVTTGNKSEMATGYATLYGDMCGGYNVLKDVYKTTVFALAKWRNAQSPVMPERVITKPPSAELKPNQTDQDSLPPYEVLDAILAQMIEGQKGIQEIIAQGFDEATVKKAAKLLQRSEYKRRQAAPGVKLTTMSFGRDWRMPLNGF